MVVVAVVVVVDPSQSGEKSMQQKWFVLDPLLTIFYFIFTLFC